MRDFQVSQEVISIFLLIFIFSRRQYYQFYLIEKRYFIFQVGRVFYLFNRIFQNMVYWRKNISRNVSCQQYFKYFRLIFYLKVFGVQFFFFLGRQRQVFIIWIRLLGFILFIRLLFRMTFIERGSWSAGVFFGIFWMVMVWWFLQIERLYFVLRGLFFLFWKRNVGKQSYFSFVLECYLLQEINSIWR